MFNRASPSSSTIQHIDTKICMKIIIDSTCFFQSVCTEQPQSWKQICTKNTITCYLNQSWLKFIYDGPNVWMLFNLYQSSSTNPCDKRMLIKGWTWINLCWSRCIHRSTSFHHMHHSINNAHVWLTLKCLSGVSINIHRFW